MNGDTQIYVSGREYKVPGNLVTDEQVVKIWNELHEPEDKHIIGTPGIDYDDDLKGEDGVLLPGKDVDVKDGDGGLRNRREGVVVAERREVGKQLVDQPVRRRHEGRCTRVVVAPANPVLDRTRATAVLREARPGEQAPMRLEHDLHSDRSPGRRRRHGPEHRLDVPEDLHGGDIARFLAELGGRPGRGAAGDHPPPAPRSGSRRPLQREAAAGRVLRCRRVRGP